MKELLNNAYSEGWIQLLFFPFPLLTQFIKCNKREKSTVDTVSYSQLKFNTVKYAGNSYQKDICIQHSKCFKLNPEYVKC